MQHLPTIDVARVGVRSKICTRCYQRPAGSEKWGDDVARPCEGSCTIFSGLPNLLIAVRKAPDDASPDQVMKQFVCPTCNATPTAGDFCVEGAARTCPLSRYGGDVLTLLDTLRKRYNKKN